MGVIFFVVLFWGEGKELENVLSPVCEITSSEMDELIHKYWQKKPENFVENTSQKMPQDVFISVF